MDNLQDPNSTKYAYLYELSLEELLKLLDVAPIPASTPEDEIYVDVLEEAIIEKETQEQTGLLPDVAQKWAEFQELYTAEHDSSAQDQNAKLESEFIETNRTAPVTSFKKPSGFRKLWRAVLVAAMLFVFLFGGMIAAQAAGIDVFGAIARWTDHTFSFGTVRSEETKESVYSVPQIDGTAEQTSTDTEYASLQDALDAYHVTEVTAPVWILDGYDLRTVDTLYSDDPESLSVYAEYFSEENALLFVIKSYTDEPSMQIEKTDTAPQIFNIGEETFYLIENSTNQTIAWFTPHFECYITSAFDQQNIQRIMQSMSN